MSLSCRGGTPGAQARAVRDPVPAWLCPGGAALPPGLCPQVSLSASAASSPGLCAFPSAPTPLPRFLDPRPPRPRGHLQVHGRQLHPDPAEDT